MKEINGERRKRLLLFFAMVTTMAMLTMIVMVTMTTMIDYWLLLYHGGGGGEGEEDRPSLNKTLKLLRSPSWRGWFAPSHRRTFAGSLRLATTAASAAGCWEGGGGWPHAALLVVRMAMAIATVWEKEGLAKGEREGKLKDGFVYIHCFHFDGGEKNCFMLSYFVIVILAYPFQCRLLILCQVLVYCWTGFSCKISLPVIQIWSSHFCLAIIVWEFTVANSCIEHWH